MIQTYKDLNVYKKAYKLVLDMYQITNKLPIEERFGLISQIKRAALSIPLNIAEGYGKRSSTMEFKRYLTMAKGSCNELQVLLDLCMDLEYISQEEHKTISERYDEVGKMLYGMLEKWNKPSGDED